MQARKNTFWTSLLSNSSFDVSGNSPVLNASITFLYLCWTLVDVLWFLAPIRLTHCLNRRFVFSPWILIEINRQFVILRDIFDVSLSLRKLNFLITTSRFSLCSEYYTDISEERGDLEMRTSRDAFSRDGKESQSFCTDNPLPPSLASSPFTLPLLVLIKSIFHLLSFHCFPISFLLRDFLLLFYANRSLGFPLFMTCGLFHRFEVKTWNCYRLPNMV